MQSDKLEIIPGKKSKSGRSKVPFEEVCSARQISDPYEPRLNGAIVTGHVSISCSIPVLQIAAPPNALDVEPGVEAFLRKIGLQALGEAASVFAGVEDENTQWFRREHWLTDYYESVDYDRQGHSREHSTKDHLPEVRFEEVWFGTALAGIGRE